MAAAVDLHSSFAHALGSPARGAFAITPDDDNDLPFVTTHLYVGSVGRVDLVTVGGDTVSFAVVPAGTTIPIRATRVLDTGTDASSIVGLY